MRVVCRCFFSVASRALWLPSFLCSSGLFVSAAAFCCKYGTTYDYVRTHYVKITVWKAILGKTIGLKRRTWQTNWYFFLRSMSPMTHFTASYYCTQKYKSWKTSAFVFKRCRFLIKKGINQMMHEADLGNAAVSGNNFQINCGYNQGAGIIYVAFCAA